MAAALEENQFERKAETAGDGGTEVAPPSASAFKRVPHYGVITVSVMLATIMQALDATIANVALPRMQGTLSATQDQMGWVLTSYIVAAAIATPLTGWLAGQFGRRRVFLISILVFHRRLRIVWPRRQPVPDGAVPFPAGRCGAALVPLSQAVLFDINAPKDFGRAMSIWASGDHGAHSRPGVGRLAHGGLQLALGILHQLADRRADLCWLILLHARKPQRAILAFRFSRLQQSQPRSRFVPVMLDRGQLLDWFSSREIILEAVIAGTAFYIFLVHNFSIPKPFLNPALSRTAISSPPCVHLPGRCDPVRNPGVAAAHAFRTKCNIP